MEDKKNTVMIDGEEITKETYEKIRKDAFEEYKMEVQQLSDDKMKR